MDCSWQWRSDWERCLRLIFWGLIFCCGWACQSDSTNEVLHKSHDIEPVLHILGTVQDGGSPHMGCRKPCCRNLFLRPATDRQVVALGLVDGASGETCLFEATPDFTRQAAALAQLAHSESPTPTRIFLTHAHIGHYSGLMFLGREALGARDVEVCVMPRMRGFLTSNGPWSQLVELGNIRLSDLHDGQPMKATANVQVTPIQVPHRDEFSETVGFDISGPTQSALFIPDINKWDLWATPLEEALSEVDFAFIDATFYDATEIGHRDMSEIPHPFMVETMDRLDHLDVKERNKVHFIHMNHTNPCLDSTSTAYRNVLDRGYHIARRGQSFGL